MGVDQYAWPRNDHGYLPHLVGKIIQLLVSSMVIPCKGPFDAYRCFHMTKQIHAWAGLHTSRAGWYDFYRFTMQRRCKRTTMPRNIQPLPHREAAPGWRLFPSRAKKTSRGVSTWRKATRQDFCCSSFGYGGRATKTRSFPQPFGCQAGGRPRLELELVFASRLISRCPLSLLVWGLQMPPKNRPAVHLTGSQTPTS